MSDILITNYVSDEHLDLYIPGKLFEYAISGKYAYAIYMVDLHGKERKYQGNFLLIR